VAGFKAQQLVSALPETLTVNPLFARRPEDLSVPRFVLPADSMLPETAYQIVHDEAMLDGNARLNLATFVTTWMEPTASKLYSDTFDKNMIDKDEYPLTAAIKKRC
jgi:glutamate decarboxylase